VPLVAQPGNKTLAEKKRKNVEVPPKVARVLKLLDKEEGSEAGEPTEALLKPVSEVCASAEESIEVIEAPSIKKRKLKKVAEPKVTMVESIALVVEPMNVAGFLAARRKKIAPPSVQCLAEVMAFIANEPVLAAPVNMAKPVEKEPLRALEGPIPSMLDTL
jgi:hypothetical protein